MREYRKRREDGFTLIELLVVIAIIGILASIAIPEFAAYRIQGFNSRAWSEGRNLISAQEAFYVDNEVYSDTASPLPGVAGSDGVEITTRCGTPGSIGNPCTQFFVMTCHRSGDTVYTWRSDTTAWTTSSIAGTGCFPGIH